MCSVTGLLRQQLQKIESEIHSALHNQGENEKKNAELLHDAVHKIYDLSLEAAKYYADYRGWPVPFNAGCVG